MTHMLAGSSQAARALAPSPTALTDAAGSPETPFGEARLVAFDLDCTLVDILRVKERACEAAAWALADAGLDIDPSVAASDLLTTAMRAGIDRDDIVDVYLARTLGELHPNLVEVGRHAYERAEDQAAVPYPRAHRTLHELGRRGYALALVSDAPRHRVVRRLQAARLAAFFEPVIALEDTPAGKRDARPFELLVERTAVEPHEVVMVGDNPRRDVASARAFGCRTVLAAYGLQDSFASEHPDHAPDRSIRWLDELLELLPGRIGSA